MNLIICMFLSFLPGCQAGSTPFNGQPVAVDVCNQTWCQSLPGYNPVSLPARIRRVGAR